MRVETKRIADLRVHHKDFPKDLKYFCKSGSFDALCEKLEKEGVRIPIIVSPRGIVLDGHYRFWAAQSSSIQEVPVIVVRPNVWRKWKTEWFARWVEENH